MSMRSRGIWSGVSLLVVLAAGTPAGAVPKFAREYGVGCEKCHSVPPRLNAFGQAFQANNFNWPEAKPPARKSGLNAFPISGIAHFSYEDNRTEDTRSTKFRELELFFSDGFRVGKRPAAGYFASTVVATTDPDGRAGELSQAFAMLPIARQRGQCTPGAGHFSRIMYQGE